jgi:hypothetical protein
MNRLIEYNSQNNNNDHDHNNSDTQTTSSENTDYSDDDNDDDYSYDYNSNFQINLSTNYLNKNILLIPEIYNKYFHGRTFDSDPNIDGQFLVLQTFYINPANNMFEFFKYVNNLSNFYRKYYKKNFCNLSLPHTLLRNYNNIIENPRYLNLEIGKIYYLKGNECVCILKTFWLKIVQRAWKKIYKIRKLILQYRCRPDSLLYKQFSGKWPENCSHMPSIKGMMMM